MANLTTEEQQKILAILVEKGVKQPCSRCGHCTHTLLEACMSHRLFDYRLQPSDASLPCVATVCNNCGYLAQHAMGVLKALLNKEIKHEH
jgi:hypothetical protein